MKNDEKNLKPEDPHVPRKRGLSFSYMVTVVLMVLVIFVAMKYEGQSKGAPADPVIQAGTHEASR